MGTCTEDLFTRDVMKASRLGREGRVSTTPRAGGVEGGVGSESCCAERGSSHLMTSDDCFARCWIM